MRKNILRTLVIGGLMVFGSAAYAKHTVELYLNKQSHCTFILGRNQTGGMRQWLAPTEITPDQAELFFMEFRMSPGVHGVASYQVQCPDSPSPEVLAFSTSVRSGDWVNYAFLQADYPAKASFKLDPPGPDLLKGWGVQIVTIMDR